MTEADTTARRITLNLTRRADEALGRLKARTGDNATDLINRALRVLDVVDRLAEEGDGYLRVQSGSNIVRIYLL